MRRPVKWAVSSMVALVVLYGGLCAGFYWAMTRPPSEFGNIMKEVPMAAMALLPFAPMWAHARAGDLAPGDRAPDFELPLRDKSGTVRLASFKGIKPVALVFGSYT